MGLLSNRLQGSTSELDLQTTSPESAVILVRWLYGEVGEGKYSPSTTKVSEEILQLSWELGLPRLSELCALHLASDVDTTNIVARVRMCEDFGLPRLRAALVSALVQDAQALHVVAEAQATLGHPALMCELLSAIARRGDAGEEAERCAKKMRVGVP